MAEEEGNEKGRLMVTKELKRLQSNPERFEQFMKSQVSPLLKSDLITVLVEFQRQKLISLSMKRERSKGRNIKYQPTTRMDSWLHRKKQKFAACCNLVCNIVVLFISLAAIAIVYFLYGRK